MTYALDFARNITKKSNIGEFIYLILNTLLVVGLFSNGFSSVGGILVGIIAYAISLIAALSPFGEWIMRLQTGCKVITRKEYIERLQPLFDEVLAEARRVNPSIPTDVKLFMSNDKEPNAFATGRKMVCLTKGFLDYSDEEIKATFAHELGHLAHKDTDFILLVTIGNFIVTAMFIMFRIFFYIFTLFVSIANRSIGVLISGILFDVFLVAMMWLWTKLGTLLVMHSMRGSEYLADEFAFNLGYGNSLCAVLDTFEGSPGNKGLWANLASTHPDSDERIGRLQQLGADYRK